MKKGIQLDAELRQDQGKGASRRLRRQGKVPGVMYGGGESPIAISLEERVLKKQMENEAFYSSVLTLNLDGKASSVILRDYQPHPAKDQVLHVDLQRVVAGQELDVEVPVHLLNADTAPGVKKQGVIIHHITELSVRCLPKNLPEAITVDVGELELGHSIHLSELVLPKGVRLLDYDPEDEASDQPVISIAASRAQSVEESEESSGSEED